MVNKMPKSHHIKLLGIGASGDRAMRQLVEQAMETLSLNWPIEEVKDINLLMHYGISGIPALIIDEKIIFQEKVPTYTELLRVFGEFIYKEAQTVS
jgi:hypothetical protein